MPNYAKYFKRGVIWLLEIRTDLALELCESQKNAGFAKTYSETKHGMKVTFTDLDGESAKILGKPEGKYATAETGRIWESDFKRFSSVCSGLADVLGGFVGEAGNGCVLVAGLGNMDVTPDSVGPRVVEKLLVTNHIKALDPPLFKEAGFGDVAAISPGVMGQTGIESSSLVISASKCCNASLIIAIDSLSSHSLSRLGTTVQITDSGISPGSGVFNTRGGITRETAGIPVISLGVPMVVDAATLALDLLEEKSDTSTAEKLFSGRGKTLFITPKETDVIVEKTSLLIASAINRVLHPNVSPDEITEYIL